MIRAAALLVTSVAMLHCQSLQLAVVGNGPIRAGNTIQISLSLVGGSGSGIAGIEESITASTGGTITVAAGPADTATGKTPHCEAVASGVYICVDVALNATTFADGIIHVYTLQIPANAAPGQSTVTLGNLAAVNAAGTPVAITGNTLNFTLASPISPCDLDGSGVTDALDLDLAIKQALGLATCTDLTGDGKCTVVDIQRVINAALGGACRTGV